jgi:hypothetical protein
MSRRRPLIAFSFFLNLEHKRPGREPVAMIDQAAPS